MSPLKLAIIIGSTRKGRFGPVPANWFAEHARRHGGFDVDVVDLLDCSLPVDIGHHGDDDEHPAVAALGQRLKKADAFVVVTPEYNHSFPAPLKAAIDYYNAEWNAKPVGFVSYGGMVGGQRAVEQLRQVFPEVHAITVRDTISFVNYWTLFDEDGNPKDAEGTSAAAKQLLDQLTWWGNALRTARNDTPYQP
ncbi:NAD(P)H-dependent FMN reductase [Stackebrandtia endophytica]|uniref:NAD(P)H-dependent FMN reductase n=1 Tax=Stackebrandtia endophytica TaxID=1496996 RepID=A0A543B0D0_9ACTN|nr:NAD(P)H-dependent oxidoreductase [Stackebrandtia endophytica]TQL78292.1 NAD(P)H-dependent FMN reductase [Stackebrandtia endophytica]